MHARSRPRLALSSKVRSSGFAGGRSCRWWMMGEQAFAWEMWLPRSVGAPLFLLGRDMLGRVLDANGQPLDGMGGYRSTRMVEIDGTAPKALERLPVGEPLGCGIGALDAFQTTCGRGQRLGILQAVASA